MKRYIQIFTIIMTMIMTMTFGSLTAFAWGAFQGELIIEYQNAPEGTAFADVLFKNTEDDMYRVDADSADRYRTLKGRYVHFIQSAGNSNFSTGRETELADNCGLDVYDDGFTSCMMRRWFVRSNDTSDGCRTKLNFDIEYGPANKSVFEYYGEFKVAYCDESGNVLLVTDAAKVPKKRYQCTYNITADGTKAVCNAEIDGFYFFYYGVQLLMILVPTLILSLIIWKLVNMGKKAAPEPEADMTGEENVPGKSGRKGVPFFVIFLVVFGIMLLLNRGIFF